MNYGDLVKGQVCPKCRRLDTIIYNGNYWCNRCEWSMGNRAVHRIIRAYLIQRYIKAEAAGNERELARISFYLAEYQDKEATHA